MWLIDKGVAIHAIVTSVLCMYHMYCSVINIKSCNSPNKLIASVEIISRLIIRKRLRVNNYSEGLSAAIEINEFNTQSQYPVWLSNWYKKKVVLLSCGCHFSVFTIHHLVVPILGQCRHDIHCSSLYPELLVLALSPISGNAYTPRNLAISVY